jgi:hypothetical protein
MFQAHNIHEEYVKFIKVTNGVISLTNGNAIIRYFCSSIPDGFYKLNNHNLLIKADIINPYVKLRYYPDIDIAKPQFEFLDRVLLDRSTVQLFIEFINYIRQSNDMARDKTYIALDQYGAKLHRMYYSYRPDIETLPEFNFPEPLPINGHSIVFDANNLKIVFTEMLRYDHIYIGYDNRAIEDMHRPLVLGLDWGHCALIKYSPL